MSKIYSVHKRHAITALLITVGALFLFHAYSTGITGKTLLNGDGCTCHNPTASGAVTVSIVGPDSLAPNQTASYSVTIANGPLTRAGTNVAVSGGSLATLLGSGLQKLGNELTHTSPKAPSSGLVTFAFNYTAPAAVGNVTMYANGNSVNFNGGNDGDEWNFANNKIIVVREPIVPVELSSFSAIVVGRDIELQWSTATESNNRGFEIERKAENEEQFTTIAFVAGNGTSANQHSYQFRDKSVQNGIYQYRLKQIDFDGTYKHYGLQQAVTITAPQEFALDQNYPNPFNPSTVLRYRIAENSTVVIRLYDIAGNLAAELVNAYHPAGEHSITVDMSSLGLSSGVYIYSLETPQYRMMKKMILAK